MLAISHHTYLPRDPLLQAFFAFPQVPGAADVDDAVQSQDLPPQAQRAVVDDAGHMLHHDQPEVLARLGEDFLQA